MKRVFFILLALSGLAALFFQIDFKRFNKQTSCAFCDKKVLEAQSFYEGERVLAMLTYKPATSGHVLIIPKRHVERFEDLTPEELSEIGSVVKRVDRKARNIFGERDYLIMQKNGKGAGQSVPHVHFHYIPAERFLALKFFLSPWLNPLDSKELMLLKEDFSESF